MSEKKPYELQLQNRTHISVKNITKYSIWLKGIMKSATKGRHNGPHKTCDLDSGVSP